MYPRVISNTDVTFSYLICYVVWEATLTIFISMPFGTKYYRCQGGLKYCPEFTRISYRPSDSKDEHCDVNILSH